MIKHSRDLFANVIRFKFFTDDIKLSCYSPLREADSDLNNFLSLEWQSVLSRERSCITEFSQRACLGLWKFLALLLES